MRERYLDVAGRCIAFSVPPPAQRLFAAQFPHTREATAGCRPRHHLAVRELDGGWVVLRDGTPVMESSRLASTVQALEYEVERVLLPMLTDRVCLHAGCVEVNGRAALLAGLPNRGKTATTLQLVEMGHGFLCEEIAPVAAASFEVDPFPRGLGVTDAYLAELERHFPLAGGRVESLGGGQARYLPHRVVGHPLQAEWVLLPRFDSRATPAVERLHPEEILTEMLSYCFEPAMETETLVDALVGLLERCSLVRLTYRDPPSARRLLGELFDA